MTDSTQPQQIIKSSKTKPVLFSLLILLSGIIIGVGATVIVLRQSIKNENSRMPEEFSRRMVERLTRELHLTGDQRQQVKPIIEKHMKAMDQYRQEARPKIRQELEQMNDELMAIFDNTQQQIWKERIQRMQKGFPKMRRRGERDGRRPGDRQYPERQGQQPRQFRRQQPGQMPPPPDEHQLPPRDELPPDEHAPLNEHEPLPPLPPQEPTPNPAEE